VYIPKRPSAYQCYMSCPSHPPRFKSVKNIKLTSNIMKLPWWRWQPVPPTRRHRLYPLFSPRPTNIILPQHRHLKPTAAQLARTPGTFYWTQCSLPPSQQPTTRIHPAAQESSAHPYALLKINFNIIIPPTPTSCTLSSAIFSTQCYTPRPSDLLYCKVSVGFRDS
jgi:hypothetical protein